MASNRRCRHNAYEIVLSLFFLFIAGCSVPIVDPCIEGSDCSEDTPECRRVECINGRCTMVEPNVECDDGNACTINDRCTDGMCIGEILECPEEMACIDGECVP